MSFRDDFRALAEDLRTLAGPEEFDIRVNKLTIVKRVWVGGRRGSYGGYQDTTWADLPQNYRMVHVSLQEINSSGGRYLQGDIKVGPITPNFDTTNVVDGTQDDSIGSESGGWSTADICPTTDQDGVDFIYRLTGEHQGDYRLVGSYTLKPFSYFLVIRRTDIVPSPDPTTPPNDTQF